LIVGTTLQGQSALWIEVEDPRIWNTKGRALDGQAIMRTHGEVLQRRLPELHTVRADVEEFRRWANELGRVLDRLLIGFGTDETGTVRPNRLYALLGGERLIEPFEVEQPRRAIQFQPAARGAALAPRSLGRTGS
jgi:hypothetical protein